MNSIRVPYVNDSDEVFSHISRLTALRALDVVLSGPIDDLHVFMASHPPNLSFSTLFRNYFAHSPTCAHFVSPSRTTIPNSISTGNSSHSLLTRCLSNLR